MRLRRGFACLVIALAMIATHGVRLAHLLLVHHEVCEHGQLVDAERSSSDALGSFPDTAGAPERAIPGKHGSHAADHEHCDAASILHRPGVVQALVASASLLRIDPPSTAEAAEIRAVAPLDLAPKASPPRV